MLNTVKCNKRLNRQARIIQKIQSDTFELCTIYFLCGNEFRSVVRFMISRVHNCAFRSGDCMDLFHRHYIGCIGLFLFIHQLVSRFRRGILPKLCVPDMATDKIGESIRMGGELRPEQLMNFYDEWYKEGSYDQIHKDAEYKAPIIVASLLSKIIEDKAEKILDIGAGTGLVGEELAKKGFCNIYAVDPSKESLNVCRERGVYNEFVQRFVGPEPLPFEDNTFTGAGAGGVFLEGHCDGTSFREVLRVVKPGGTIVITVRKLMYNNPNFDLRAVSDELVAAKKCSIVEEDIPDFSQGSMGVAIIYTVL